MGSKSATTIREAYVQASSFLRDRGVPEPNANVDRLMQYVLGTSRSDLLLRWDEPFPEEKVALWQQLLHRRGEGIPVQYLTGEEWFYGLSFRVNEAVLIPRPETELLVERIVERGRKLWPNGGVTAADIGTGSGAIAVSLAVLCPDWRLVATDLSTEALRVARQNAKRHGVAERILFREGDLLAPLMDIPLEVDVLVSNPPYIPSGDIPGLQTEVKDHEPRLALDGGEDGLDCYRAILAQIKQLARPPRLVGFEVGAGQAAIVADWLKAAGYWESVELIRDLAGIDRHVVAER